MNLGEIKEKLRQLDVNSGFYDKVAFEHVAKISEDLAFNDVADLVAEVERLNTEVERLKVPLKDFADPDNWLDEGDGQYVWHGFPPYETAAQALLGSHAG